jgi:lytic murein transglycosylase
MKIFPSWPGLSRPSMSCGRDVPKTWTPGTWLGMTRLFVLIITSLLMSLPARADDAFQAWLQSLWPQAQALGVSRATFDDATRGLEPDLTLPDLVLPGRPERPEQGQAEFVQTPADYLKESTFDRLAAQGRKLLDQYRAPLAAIEQQFGVTPTIVLAIFGRETDYGRARDQLSAIRVLATQAYFGKRKDKFLNEFLLALKILQEGQIKLADMKSSWAGAMGLTQFLPSDYLKYAVDLDGDGRADI